MSTDQSMDDLLGRLQQSIDDARSEPAVHTPPSATADLTRIRYARDGGGWKVYVGGDLLGRIHTRRVPVTKAGKKQPRWFYVPAAWGWTVRGLEPPPAAMVQTEVGQYAGSGRNAGARPLVEHLHRHGCPAVAPLYPDRAPDV